MTPEDSLFSIAEISIGLAGFSGLVAAFVQHPGQSWRADQKARIVLLVALSFGMIIAALAPYALSGISTSPALVWGAPMVTFSTLCIALLTHWVVVARKRDFKLQFPLISIPTIAAAAALQILAFLSGWGWIFPYSPAVFVLGLLSVLVFGAIVFLALLDSIWE
jgi:peptidoglycan/LPS O-acetylase OafA/YrhL